MPCRQGRSTFNKSAKRHRSPEKRKAGRSADAPFKVGQPNRDSVNCPLTFSFGDDGSLRINLKAKYDNPQVILDEEVGAKTISETYVEFNAGSSVTFSADVEIDAQELDRIVKTDYASYDFEVPLAAKQGQLNEDEAAAKAMGEFQFGEGFKVDVSCTAVLNGGEMMAHHEF